MKILRKEGVTLGDGGLDPSWFDDVDACAIACCNWPGEYPYAPEVSFRMFHNGEYLFIRFDVTEDCTAARVADDNGRVWTDSCVEFFIRPKDSAGYYNFELTCIGRLLLGYRKSRNDAVHAPRSVMQSVRRLASLGTETFDEVTGRRSWWVVEAIPATALFGHDFKSWDGIEATMNLYKCGDNLSKPHFLSWQPIEAPAPNFHLPEFFAPVTF